MLRYSFVVFHDKAKRTQWGNLLYMRVMMIRMMAKNKMMVVDGNDKC